MFVKVCQGELVVLFLGWFYNLTRPDSFGPPHYQILYYSLVVSATIAAYCLSNNAFTITASLNASGVYSITWILLFTSLCTITLIFFSICLSFCLIGGVICLLLPFQCVVVLHSSSQFLLQCRISLKHKTPPQCISKSTMHIFY